MSKYSEYLVEYYHDGSFWSLTIPATSRKDVQDRLRQMQYAKVLGEVGCVVPGNCGWVALAWCWISAWMRRGGAA